MRVEGRGMWMEGGKDNEDEGREGECGWREGRGMRMEGGREGE